MRHSNHVYGRFFGTIGTQTDGFAGSYVCVVELVSDQVGSPAAQVLMSMTQNGMKRAPFYATNGIGVRGKFTLHLASRHVQDLDVAIVTA